MALLMLAAPGWAAGAATQDPAATGAPGPCRQGGRAQAARCGWLRRPLDPARPQGTQIEVHYALLPALAPRKAADPVVFFAGGPGQSAIDLAGPLAARFARWGQRHDLVFIDQRGTGRSAPLYCADDDPDRPQQPLRQALGPAAQRLARLQACRQALQALPQGDLRHYTTTLAVADVDAVRQALGVERINAVGASYGTRVVLEYLRQFPTRVRRAVLDGVVPPDMHLADAAGPDNQAALDALLAACRGEAACAQAHPRLPDLWQGLLASLPREVSLPHPVSGQIEIVTLDRDTLLGWVRAPLYTPALAAALPAAIQAAADGRWAPLMALASPRGGGPASRLATGMHFSVVCAEDMAPAAAGQPATAASATAAAGFGNRLATLYQQVCADWPRGAVPAGFASVPPSAAPVWLLSGGLDPVTPPRHAQRMAQALGPLARHTVVPHSGHGVLALACLRDAVGQFISADSDLAALAATAAPAAQCAAQLPRPLAFVVPGWLAGAPTPSAPQAPR